VPFAGAAAGGRICACKIENGLSADTETVRAVNRHPQPEKIAKDVVRDSGGRWVHILQPQTRGCVTNEVVPTLGGLAGKGDAQVAVLIALEGVVGNAEELDCVGLAESRCGVAARNPQVVVGIQRQTQIGYVGSIMEGIVGNAVGRIEAREIAKVIQAL